MSEKIYRIGIIGIGGIATMHANAIGDLPNAQLVAGVCRTESKGRAFAKQFGCNWYPSDAQMMEKEKPDIVCITTPSGAHLEPVCEAAKRGIDVICEKPLEITCQRIDQMIQMAKETGIMLAGIFPQRFNPPVQAIHQAVLEGRFGKIAMAGAYVPWWRDDAYYAPGRWQGTAALDGGGAMMNQSIHNVDAIQWLMGADPALSGLAPGENPVQQVYAYIGQRGHDASLLEVEDTAVAVLMFKNGALGQLLGATSMYPGTPRRLSIAGRDGTAEVVEERLTAYHFRESRSEDDVILAQYAQQAESSGASDPLAISYEGHTRNIGAILQAMDEGKSPPIDGVESRKAVAIIEAIYASAATGKPVEVS